jgi:hypothetical protein
MTAPRPDELPKLKSNLRQHLDQAKEIADRLGYQGCAYLITSAIEDARQHDGHFPVEAPDELKN